MGLSLKICTQCDVGVTSSSLHLVAVTDGWYPLVNHQGYEGSPLQMNEGAKNAKTPNI